MPNNGYSAPCVTSQPGPWDDDNDSLYEMAGQAWNECWPDEPAMSVASSKWHLRKLTEGWLIEAFINIVKEYDGPVSDIADHLGDFGNKWIQMRAEAIEFDAREAEAEARADAAEFARDYREGR